MRRIALLLLAATSLNAQSVRGTVADAGGIRVPGVVVVLLAANDSIVSRALSDANGAFLVATPRAGDYRVRTLRIGYKPVTSEVITLTAGQQVTRTFELAGVAVQLGDVRIESESGCRRSAGDSTGAAFAAWEQLRTAMAATQITASSRGMTVTTVEYSRSLDHLLKQIISSDATVRTSQVNQPWREQPIDKLRRDGYVVQDVAGSYDYYVPGLETLSSSSFLEDHCLRVARESTPARLGISFEPTSEREKVAEVSGIAWLDRETSELRDVTYRYENVTVTRREGAGGNIEFTRMTDGTWVISHWYVRMPEIERRNRSTRFGGVEERIMGYRETGAELTVARRGADTLWKRAPIPLDGTVIDSATNTPVLGAVARLVGTGWSATSDVRGRFTIRAIPGEYTLEVTTPSLDSVKAVHQQKITFIDSTKLMDVKVPNADFIRRVMGARNASIFMGQVLADSTNQPLRDVEIAISSLSKSVKTDSLGRFRIADVPAGIHTVVARKVGLGAYEAPTYFRAGAVVQRQIMLSRMTALDAVTVTAAAAEAGLPKSFEDNKKLGLGRFVTRDMIDRYSAMSLQTVLSQVPTVRLMVGGQRNAWLSSSRMPMGRVSCTAAKQLYGENTYCPTTLEVQRGIFPGCYAQVWIDRLLMNPERPTEPFDVNTIPPDQIEAMEYYAGPAQTPAEYSRLNATCGVLVVHTRRHGNER